MKHLISYPLLIITLLPLYAYAGTSGTTEEEESMLHFLAGFLSVSAKILFTCAFILFFTGIIRYIFLQGRSTEKGGSGVSARYSLVWPAIAIFVLTSIWGILSLLVGIFFDGEIIKKGRELAGQDYKFPPERARIK